MEGHYETKKKLLLQVPIRIHTHLTCLLSSHCLVLTQLHEIAPKSHLKDSYSVSFKYKI